MLEESGELWKDYATQQSPTVKEELIGRNIILVQKIANKMASSLPSHIARDDLYSYGVFGLLEAMDRYNPELGIPFSAFAVKRIKGAIIDGIRKEDWVPVSVRKKAKLLEQSYRKIEGDLERNATDQEVAHNLGITVQELNNWLLSIQYITVLSLDEPLGQGEENSLRDTVTDYHSPNPAQLSETKEVKETLVKAVNDLPDKEKLVITLFYYEDMTNKEIAEVLELSVSRISQLHTKAIFRLRGKLSRFKKNLF